MFIVLKARAFSALLSKQLQNGRLLFAAYLHSKTQLESEFVQLFDKVYSRDGMTNVTTNILSKIGRKLHLCKNHPISILREKIHVYADYITRSMADYLSPVVTWSRILIVYLSLKIDHVGRARNDNYYINSEYLLRAHTSAHQRDLIKIGLDPLLVRLFSQHQLFSQYKVNILFYIIWLVFVADITQALIREFKF